MSDRAEIIIGVLVVAALFVACLLLSDDPGTTALALLTASPFCIAVGYFMHR